MQKSIGEKVLGWFVVEETDEPAKAAAVTTTKTKPPPAAPSTPARGALTGVPSLADDDRDRLGRVLTLLDRLPPEATPEMKRALVAASLEAFGVHVDAIIGSSQRALAALDAFSETTRAKSENAIAEAEARVARLNQEIVELQRAANAQRAANEEVLRQTAMERSRLQAALAFLQRG